MSRRTAEASKAIRQAWQKEQERVLSGKGTRDWTPEQQQDIIDKGKAYDADGKAFEGQHMKSAEKYPEYQGDPDNIQFLTKKEHLDAHRGNWQNPTNWYYDPVTYEFTDFGEGKYIPCTVIDLSHPIITISVDAEKTGTEPVEKVSSPTEDSKKVTSPKPTVEKAAQEESSPQAEVKKKPTANSTETKPKSPEEKTGFMSRAKRSLRKAGKKIVTGGKKAGNVIASGSKAIGTFVMDNKDIILPIVGAIGGAILTSKLNDSDSGSYDESETKAFTPEDTAFEPSTPKITSSQEDITADDISPETADRPYTPNDVPEGKQRYHYADGSVRERGRAAYSRGKKKDNTNEDDEEDS